MRSFRQAVKAFEHGKLAEAVALCEKILAEDPVCFDALHLLGVVQSRLRQFDGALVAFDRALALRAGDPGVCNNRGTALAEMLRFPEALESYDRAIAGRSDFAEAQNNRGCVLIFMERFEDALSSYANALIARPDSAEYMNNMGRALMLLRRYREALDCFADAIAQKPGFADAMLNRGEALEELRAYDDAVVAYGEAMDAGVDMIETILRRARALDAGKRYREAVSDYKRALRLAPQRQDILVRRGSALARLGRIGDALADFDQALAAGIEKGHVLSARCFAFAAWECFDQPVEIGRCLLDRVSGEDGTIGRPYVLAEEAHVAAWAKQLPQAPLRVGIAWRASVAIAGRSVPLIAFKPLTEVPGVRLISLQTSEEPDETEPRLAEMTVHTLGAGFGEGAGAFLDTAAVMMSLDLVISVDTAIAHLAGTIGRPTWIILKTAPGRHGIPERSDTPWYPSARLFRRKEGQDWTHTMAAVAEALASMARAAVAAPGRC